MSAGEKLWRAQLGSEGDGAFTMVGTDAQGRRIYAPTPFSKERMKPKSTGATEGRANVKGIPALYAATVAETALSEMRPSRGQILSLAELQIIKAQRLVDMTLYGSSHTVFEIGGNPSQLKSNPPDQDELEGIIWRNMDDAFAAPVERTDTSADYAATQNIAEVLKLAGWDGLIYRSFYGPKGKNVVLFDLEAAGVVNVTLRRVANVEFEFGE